MAFKFEIIIDSWLLAFGCCHHRSIHWFYLFKYLFSIMSSADELEKQKLASRQNVQQICNSGALW